MSYETSVNYLTHAEILRRTDFSSFDAFDADIEKNDSRPFSGLQFG
jgi:hypothetical protein